MIFQLSNMDLPPDNRKTVSVLVVEDDEDYAFLVRKMLSQASTEFEVSHAARLAEARERLLESPAGCVLLDLSLPDARRLQALMQLRAVAPDVPIVVLSGLEEDLLAVRAVQEGAQDYLTKWTVDPQALGRSISYAIEQKQAERQLADEALHDSMTGLPSHELFDEGMHARLVERSLERELNRAVEREEFEVIYQPQIDVQSGTIYGVEALARWDHPERGVVEPGEFLLLAEKIGLIIPIGAEVLRRACRQAQRWRAAAPTLKVAVNLSGPEYRRPDLIDAVEQALAESGADPASLCLEVTERVMMEDVNATIEKLGALRALGVKLSLDNFGAGGASLSTLRGLPVDFLKLDRSLITGVGEDAESAAIVACLIDLASELGMTTIAEGVDSTKRLAALREMGCDLAQGYYLSRPRPADVISELLGAR